MVTEMNMPKKLMRARIKTMRLVQKDENPRLVLEIEFEENEDEEDENEEEEPEICGE